MMKVILASASPRRRELLSRLIPQFEVDPAHVDETGDSRDPVQLAEELAVRKAKEVWGRHSQGMVIGADTIVTVEGKVLGKPEDEADAVRMLARLSGRTHQVITGVAILTRERMIRFHQVTDVTFVPLEAAEIRQYVETGEPMDKAGAYGIQGVGALLVQEIHGDYWNVVGFPLSAFRRRMREAGWGRLLSF